MEVGEPPVSLIVTSILCLPHLQKASIYRRAGPVLPSTTFFISQTKPRASSLSSFAEMKFLIVSSLALLSAVASAAPTATLQKRADICGQWDSATTGTYTLYQDLWNEDEGTGSQCSGIDSLSGSTIAWHTTYDFLFISHSLHQTLSHSLSNLHSQTFTLKPFLFTSNPY